MFTSSKDEIKKFVEKLGKNNAYYIGYFMPLENLEFLNTTNTNLEELGNVTYHERKVKKR
ncbi:MAG: hypothetical protein OSJ70_04915 [Bacilli bacterium]|nr:hypothetical protein [Bacilli bacterium]